MKTRLTKKSWMIMIICVLCCLPVVGMADGAGALSESELNTWVTQILRESAEETPLNAPVGEEALTEDGYAFLYSFATLYYDKPVLDEASVLKAVVVTDEGFPTVRGIRLGDDASVLMDCYGWQNSMLIGNGAFAALYEMDRLPEAAYWSWAGYENEKLLSLQCAIHVRLENDRYTDAGINYAVENGKISAIRVYGLDATISVDEVKKNLVAVESVAAAISGDEPEKEIASQGYLIQNDAAPFGANDLLFGGVNYLNMTEQTAQTLFGKALSEEKVQDDTGAWLLTTKREGLSLSYTLSDESAVLETFSVTGQLKGPRGVQTGMKADEVIQLFRTDGTGAVADGVGILYGDGANAPTGVMESDSDGITALRYTAMIQTTSGDRMITLHLSFTSGLLNEWMLYSW
ncbi:MAG: hypothetical protein PHI98_05760 [Eubacteriales bacterium]|nr:hypothetical protein [Eubacteriales bacterium]